MINPKLKAIDRIYKELPQDLQELMRQHVLSDEEHKLVLEDIKKKSYFEKTPVDKPKFIIVLGQTGSGKSNLTTSLIRQEPNLVVIDSDKYKAYRTDSSKIQREHFVEYAFLTAPDAYQHRDEMICDTMNSKYNILVECATSEKDGMFVDLEQIKEAGYDIEIEVLAVSHLNSLLSIHERYEAEIQLGSSAAKLTNINRHDDSFTSLRKCVMDVQNKDVKVSVYKRGEEVLLYTPKKMYSSTDEIQSFSSAVEALDYIQLQDKKNVLKDFYQRYTIIQQQMFKRNAPNQQIEQLEEIRRRGIDEQQLLYRGI